MIPLKINGKNLCEIFEPDKDFTSFSNAQIIQYSIDNLMFPTEVTLSAETYSRDAERTLNYELENLTTVNRKSKPVFVWQIIKAEYVANLLAFLKYKYNFKDASGNIVPVLAETIVITYYDFVGMREINAYLGQTLEGTLTEYNGQLYWENFRIAFPER